MVHVTSRRRGHGEDSIYGESSRNLAAGLPGDEQNLEWVARQAGRPGGLPDDLKTIAAA